MVNGQWGGLLTIVEEADVTDLIDAECLNYPRLREGWEALHWLLARSAHKIGRAPNQGNPALRLYVQAGDPVAKLPVLWVLYELGADEVVIAALKVVPYEPVAEE